MRKGANLFVIFFITLLLLSIPFCFSMEVNLTYDGNGNLITGDGKYREYNEFNQLVRVRAGYSDAGRLLEEYVYHPTEERILAKNIYDFDENLVETVIYVNENFERKINESGTYDSVYVKDEEGNLIAEERLAIDEVLFYHNDHLGSTSVITNESGDAVETTFYEPYGDILEGGNETRYDYEGKEFSSLTEDYDFHFRKYDPGLSIFTQPDSGVQNVYDPQNLNRYSFERRNPYKYVDEDGKTFINPSDIFAIDPFKYAWKFGQSNIFSHLAQDISNVWKSDEMRYYRGVWSATGEPFYDVTSGSTELMAYVSQGKDHPFASKNPLESVKKILFGGSSATLLVAGFSSNNMLVQGASYADTALSVSFEVGIVENTFNILTSGGSSSSSISYDSSRNVNTGSSKSWSSGSIYSKSKSSSSGGSSWYSGVKKTVSNVSKKVKSGFRRVFRR